MKALILAAGYATRLYPLTKEYPKPLLTVNHRPIINYIIDKIEPLEGIDEIIIVTNSKFFARFKSWRRKLRTKKTITVLDDLTRDNHSRLGAIGDMGFVISRRKIKDDLLVIGGDNLFDGGLEEFLAFARTHHNKPVIGAYNIKYRSKARHYGVIRLDRSKRVVDFQEKPKHPHSAIVAMCLYYFPKDELSLIKKYQRRKDKLHDATGFYIDWLRKKVAVYSFVFNGRWYDIGDHKFYGEAKVSFLKK
jgi:glucose-1-phosphate thymidylyltransferase